MIEAIKKYKRVILIIVVLFIAFLVYSYFKGGNETSSNEVLVTTDPNGGVNNAMAEQFFNQLLTLQSLHLDSEIFADPRFQSLEDFSQEIPDEPIGRPNPFAPVGADTANGPITNIPNRSNLNFTSTTSSSFGR